MHLYFLSGLCVELDEVTSVLQDRNYKWKYGENSWDEETLELVQEEADGLGLIMLDSWEAEHVRGKADVDEIFIGKVLREGESDGCSIINLESYDTLTVQARKEVFNKLWASSFFGPLLRDGAAFHNCTITYVSETSLRQPPHPSSIGTQEKNKETGQEDEE